MKNIFSFVWIWKLRNRKSEINIWLKKNGRGFLERRENLQRKAQKQFEKIDQVVEFDTRSQWFRRAKRQSQTYGRNGWKFPQVFPFAYKTTLNFTFFSNNLKQKKRYELVEMLTERIEKSLGTSIDNHVNEAFNNCKLDSDIVVQNKMAETICNEIMKTKE